MRPDLLRAWGGLSVADGFIQRSAVPPTFLRPARFLAWFERQAPELVPANHAVPAAAGEESVIFVMLRRPSSAPDESRDDPFYELGCFGLTGCHQANLLAGDRAAGARLAFVQGGKGELRLVHVTPPVRVEPRGHRRVATWSPAEMPLRFEDAPVLVDNRLAAPETALRRFLRGTARDTPVQKFSSRFRSRVEPLPAGIAREVVDLWTRSAGAARSASYIESLPYPPPRPRSPAERRRRFRELLVEVGSLPRGPRRC